MGLSRPSAVPAKTSDAMATPGRKLVLFDLDGTLVRRDTMFMFLRHTHRPPAFAGRMTVASPLLAAHAVGLASAAQAKEGLLRAFYRGWRQRDLLDHGQTFAAAIVQSADALHLTVVDRLERHRRDGDTVCIVSASPAAWVRPLADCLRVEAICTELEFDASERFTGRLAGPNVNGIEKAHAISARHDLKAFDRIVAFGNSSGDLPMLRLAHEAYVVARDGSYSRVHDR